MSIGTTGFGVIRYTTKDSSPESKVEESLVLDIALVFEIGGLLYSGVQRSVPMYFYRGLI